MGGESGVGKSTFINAFVNYLPFDTFERACSSKPVVLMPVSFLITVGDQFEEQTVKFGDDDSNEDHNHPGQSVTQHFRSYVFKMNEEMNLRIIDTPGIGDSRGIDQDDLNMQNILLLINNLSHVNVICILLKPNESRLNIILRSYFNRLLNFFGENACHNIVFCFTNTRATFYAPGDTAPLLKKMINSVPDKHIPFNKANTFSFDNESFRYLVAVQDGIKLDKYQEEYRSSWKVPVTESNRLFKYVSEELTSFIDIEWHSSEPLHLKVNEIIRPTLEAMRNILRNIALLDEKKSKAQIKLKTVAVSQSSSICSECKRTPKEFNGMWILPDDLHLVPEMSSKCKCGHTKHINVNYKLEYETWHDVNQPSIMEMKSNFNKLKEVILELHHFYVYISSTPKQNDLLLIVLNQTIAQESQICSEKVNQPFILHQNNERFIKSIPVNIRIIIVHKPVFINNKLPIDVLIINNTFECLFKGDIFINTKQLHILPIVLIIIINKPKRIYKSISNTEYINNSINIRRHFQFSNKIFLENSIYHE
ncbi:unnamed protein product [Rotaria sp. Silwood1]|nr:unnamed protein product [Rotaria sp. Silwood1]CAF1667490.1 unnamed protein product [Rotaria sp. Silwood1]